METILAKREDKKTKAKKLSLQWVFSGADQQDVSNCISGKRDAGVCTTKQDFNNAQKGTGVTVNSANNNDGLLGSLMLDQLVGQFMGAVLCPFLPAFLQGIDISTTADLADEFWMDRRLAPKGRKSSDLYGEMTYFPL